MFENKKLFPPSDFKKKVLLRKMEAADKGEATMDLILCVYSKFFAPQSV